MLHQIVTTEKVPITFRVAGLGSRFLAWLVDIGVIGLLGLVGSFVSVPLDAARAGVGTAFLLVWIFGLQWGYFLFFEWLWYGQTPGKRLLSIRVIQQQGTAISFYQAAVRNIVRAADAPLPLFYAIGFVVAACNRHHRRLGDLAADTLVVHLEHRARAVQALPDAPLVEQPDPQLRQRLGLLDRRQKQAILDLCLRREQLPPRDRARMFLAAADHFQERLGLPRAEHQSPEKYVLQLAALLGERNSAEPPPVPARVLRHARHSAPG